MNILESIRKELINSFPRPKIHVGFPHGLRFPLECPGSRFWDAAGTQSGDSQGDQMRNLHVTRERHFLKFAPILIAKTQSRPMHPTTPIDGSVTDLHKNINI